MTTEFSDNSCVDLTTMSVATPRGPGLSMVKRTRTVEDMWMDVKDLASRELTALKAEPRDFESDKQLKRLETVAKVLKQIPTLNASQPEATTDMTDEEADQLLG